MAARTSLSIAQPLPAERFFRVSLFLLLLTAILTLVGTGKIDLFTSIVATFALLYRVRRWWYGHEPELTSRTATFMVLCYLIFFPMDMFFLSRSLAANSPNPPLYAALISSVHFLIFVLLVTVYIGAILCGTVLFFLLPRVSAGYLGKTSFNPTLLSGFTDQVELGQIGEIKKSSAVVLRVETGSPVNYPALRWRGNALANFDGRRWTSAERSPETLSANSDGWIALRDKPKAGELRGQILQFTVLQEPMASDARIPVLARTATQHAATPYDKAVALESFLKTKFAYTLNLTGTPGKDPLAHFLFETRAGHCEYFASAMTVMLRTLGIPSREVNGFLTVEFNELSCEYIVRASDAHSMQV